MAGNLSDARMRETDGLRPHQFMGPCTLALRDVRQPVCVAPTLAPATLYNGRTVLHTRSDHPITRYTYTGWIESWWRGARGVGP